MNPEETLKRGIGLHQAGRYSEAEVVYRQLLAKFPTHPITRHFLGMAIHYQGRSEEAYPLVKETAAIVDTESFWSNFGSVCRVLKKNEEAEAALLKAVQKDPRGTPAFNNLGNLYADMGRLDEAVAAFRKALEIDPLFPSARGNLGRCLANAGRYDESFAELRQALLEKPNANEHGDLCFYMHFDPKQDATSVFAEHECWGRLYSGNSPRPAVRDQRSDRVLRIGYVGGDFREHPAGHLMLPLIENHDRAQFEIFLYATFDEENAIQARFKRTKSHFTVCRDMTDAELASRIRADGIDILVDCANHTSGNRLELFALRPAPLQFTMVGFPSTTGSRAIDFRFTDSFFDPVGSEEILRSSEQLVRIDPCAWCYDPGEGVPDVHAIPAEKNGYITFGSQNSLHKAGEKSVELWASVLKAVPMAKMLLVGGNMDGRALPGRVAVLQGFERAGIHPDRLIMVDRCQRADYFKRYGEIDIALDPFPGHGGLTTLDGLYMGVPLVTLSGQTYASRTGVSMLHNVGLPELVAETPEAYVARAAELAADLGKLRELRQGLRTRMRTGVLMDGPGYARRVEAAYREKWSILCSGQSIG